MRKYIKVEWVTRCYGYGLADVVTRENGKVIQCVRVHGNVVDNYRARVAAIAFDAGKPLPSGVSAFR